MLLARNAGICLYFWLQATLAMPPNFTLPHAGAYFFPAFFDKPETTQMVHRVLQGLHLAGNCPAAVLNQHYVAALVVRCQADALHWYFTVTSSCGRFVCPRAVNLSGMFS